MTQNYHTPLTIGAPANAATVNGPLGQLDSAIAGLATNTALLDYVLSTGGPITQADGAASAAQKVVTVDSTTGFLGGCYVEYALATGVIERNVVATVDSGTQLTFTTNIGTGGIANNALIAVIPVSLYNVQHTRLNAVYCFGDSLSTDGKYDTQLQAELGSTWVVRSVGIGGNTTAQMAARLATDVTNAGDAEYVVVLGGINDVVADVAAVDIETNLQTIYTALAAAGATVIALTITPFKTNTNWSAGRQTVLDAVNTWILNTATSVDYTLDAYDLLEDGTSDTLQAAYDSGDHLHLSTAGYAALGTAIYGAATWTDSGTPVAISATGTAIGLNQSLLTTDNVQFSNIGSIWRPLSDSTAALKIDDAASSNTILTVDTTNLCIGIYELPATDTALRIGRRDVGGGDVKIINILGGKADASGTNSAYGLLSQVYNYALSADSVCTQSLGVYGQAGNYSASGKTATTTSAFAIYAGPPLASGAGTNAITEAYGLYAGDQGGATIVDSFGLFIAPQTGAGAYAFYSNTGKHVIGTATATIGFYGVTPIARATLATGGGASVDDVIGALQDLGLVKQA